MHQDEHDRFVDDLLDASLARYCSVVPRPGLENRILARFRIEQVAAPWRAWAWRMGAGLAAAGAILAVVSAAYRWRLQAPISVTQPPRPVRKVEVSPKTAAVLPAHSFTCRHKDPGLEGSAELQRGSADLVSKSAPVAHFGKPGNTEVAQSPAPQKEPRLDVFPSPAPLSEEERLLVSLVRQSPERAWAAALPEQGEAVASSRVPDLKVPPLETKDLSGDAIDRSGKE
jgi:hypothetical protein